ncbi:MAG: TonB-dependent receptor [Cyanobacteria bacterium J06621_8]
MVNINSQAHGTEKGIQSKPATTVEQWQSHPRQSLFLQKLLMGGTPALDSSFNGGNLRNGLSRKTALLRFVGNQHRESGTSRSEFGVSSRKDRAVSQLGNSVAVVTDIEVRVLDDGIEIILNTDEGKTLQGITSTEDKSLIIDIPNARLELLEPRFVRQNPTEGISQVEVIPLGEEGIRVFISGVEDTPTGEAVSTDQGLTISATPTAPVDDATALDQVIDIVVTAEKRPANIQDVPISITPITQQEVEDGDITSLRDIAENTPNFTTYNPSRNFVTYSVRGFSNFNFISRDSVAFYVDDVPYDYTNFLGVEVFEIERVETLRGAQATLYGRNAQAGVVNIVTKQPAEELDFSGAIGYGNFDNFNVQTSVSAPIIADKLSFRLSGSYETRDGFTENTFLDEDIDTQSGFTARGKLLWTPTENVSVAFNASVDDNNDGSQPFVDLNSEDPFSVEQDFIGFNNLDTNTQSIRVDYEHSAFRLTSISARRFSGVDFQGDSDIFTPPKANIGIQFFDIDSDSISQEIRFQSPENSERFQWLAGGYLEFRDFDINENGFITNDGTNSAEAEVDENTLAFFGQVSYEPIEALTLTAGLRYEDFDSEMDLVNTFTVPGFDPFVTSAFEEVEQDDDILLPRLVAQYRFNPRLMVYGSVARGYKPAGVSFSGFSEETVTFDTETSLNYEIGLKSSFLKDRLQLNVAAFISPVEDFQLLAFDTVSFNSLVANTDADIAGFEVELRSTPFKGFEAIAGFGYVDATFDEFTDPFDSEEIDGNTLPYVPEYTFNLALQYRFPVGIFTRVELQGFGQSFFSNDNGIQQDAYALFNARVGYERDNYGVYFFANNIFDTEYLTSAFDFGTLGEIASFGAPATYGFQVRTKF